MVRVVTSIILILVLCLLVVLNLDYKTPVNLFWVVLDRVSVVAVALVSFVVGVLYSFFLYAARYINGMRKSALASRRTDLDRREKEAAALAAQTPAGPDSQAANAAGAGVLSRLKRRRKNR